MIFRLLLHLGLLIPNEVLVFVMLVLIMDERVLTFPSRLLTAVFAAGATEDFLSVTRAFVDTLAGILTGLVLVDVAWVTKLVSDSAALSSSLADFTGVVAW